ncbi:MAG: Uma2 family endonuclease [Deinococcota bacterium]|nr:Uma2 family endonuclease [Deinococcota bacterium]
MPDDGFRYELVRGELIRMTPTGNVHGRVAGKVAISLGSHVQAKGLGEIRIAETGFLLAKDPDTLRVPEVAFISQARLDEVGLSEGYWPGAPDLAVEVISPSDRYSDVADKVAEYLGAGARMVVIINPRKHEVTTYRAAGSVQLLKEGDVLEGDDVVPGWALPVAEMFR